MKKLILLVIIALIFVFTGTWVFGGLSWLSYKMGDIFSFLKETLDFFGFNKGIL